MMRQVLGSVSFVLCLAILLLVGNGVSQAAQASSAQVPTPTRPAMWPVASSTPAATVAPGTPTVIPSVSKPGSIGGFIELDIRTAQVRPLWTIVQWQDGQGNWHDVEGWQGTPGEGNRVAWWVSPDNLGQGPFRWAAYQDYGGSLLALSEPFHLPYRAGEVVRTELSIVAQPR